MEDIKATKRRKQAEKRKKVEVQKQKEICMHASLYTTHVTNK